MKLRYGLSYVILAIVILLLASSAAQAQDVAAAARTNRANHINAQTPAEALKTCVTDNTTGKDRKDLAKWIFFAMAAHPEIKQYADAKVTAAADETSKAMGAMVTRLLTDTCVNEFKTVVNTGQASQGVKLAFGALGELAMQELMADKDVQGAMGTFGQYVNQPLINAVAAGQ